MDALVGGEVQGKVSVVVAWLTRFGAQTEQACREDLADLTQALGSCHAAMEPHSGRLV